MMEHKTKNGRMKKEIEKEDAEREDDDDDEGE